MEEESYGNGTRRLLGNMIFPAAAFYIHVIRKILLSAEKIP